jgi:hypothetical protein
MEPEFYPLPVYLTSRSETSGPGFEFSLGRCGLVLTFEITVTYSVRLRELAV